MRRERFSTLHVVLAVIAVLVGVGIGRQSLQGDLRAARDALETCETQVERVRRDVGQQIARAFGGGSVVDFPTPPDPTHPPEPVAEPAPEPEPSRDAPFEVQVDGPELSEGSREQLDAVSDAFAIRRAQSRRALVEQADPSDEQLDEIDAAIDEMNDILVEEAELFLEAVRDRGPTRREGLEFARNSIDALLLAEDAISGTLTDDQLETVDPEVIDPFGFVSPELVETLIELDR